MATLTSLTHHVHLFSYKQFNPPSQSISMIKSKSDVFHTPCHRFGCHQYILPTKSSQKHPSLFWISLESFTICIMRCDRYL